MALLLTAHPVGHCGSPSFFLTAITVISGTLERNLSELTDITVISGTLEQNKQALCFSIIFYLIIMGGVHSRSMGENDTAACSWLMSRVCETPPWPLTTTDSCRPLSWRLFDSFFSDGSLIFRIFKTQG